MDKQQTRGQYRVGPGASSLLLIFVAVCLTTMGILTLISALADSRMSDRSMAHTTAYFEATSRVQREVGVLDGQLKSARDQAQGDLSAYQRAVKDLVGDQIAMKVTQDGEDAMAITCYIPIEQDNHLEVTMRVPLLLTGPRYEVTRQVAVNTADWKPDDNMDVYGETGAFFDDEDEETESLPVPDADDKAMPVQPPEIGEGESIQAPDGE